MPPGAPASIKPQIAAAMPAGPGRRADLIAHHAAPAPSRASGAAWSARNSGPRRHTPRPCAERYPPLRPPQYGVRRPTCSRHKRSRDWFDRPADRRDWNCRRKRSPSTNAAAGSRPSRLRHQDPHGRVVDRHGLRRLIFGQIDGGIGGGVDDPLGAGVGQRASDGLLVADVEFGAAPGEGVVPRGRRSHDRACDLAAAAEHQDSHANFSISAKLVPRASLADSFGATPSGSGQRIFKVGSFHARVRSCGGL